jgi:BlaI family penicillinase repressor
VPSEPTNVGRVQLRILGVLWDRGQATAREITDALQADGPIAHSTVQTLLRQLEKKGAVDHRVDDRTFVFRPRVTRDEVTSAAAEDLLSTVFDGSAVGLVAHIVKHEDLSRGELDAIRRLIDQKEDER